MVVAPRFEDAKSPDFKYVFATGVFGGLDPNGGRIIFFLDRIEPETTNEPMPGTSKVKKVVRELQVEVHMSPTQFKSIANWMMEHIARFEEAFGSIPLEPKKPSPPKTGMVT